jgi:hypothetical protein
MSFWKNATFLEKRQVLGKGPSFGKMFIEMRKVFRKGGGGFSGPQDKLDTDSQLYLTIPYTSWCFHEI